MTFVHHGDRSNALNSPGLTGHLPDTQNASLLESFAIDYESVSGSLPPMLLSHPHVISLKLPRNRVSGRFNDALTMHTTDLIRCSCAAGVITLGPDTPLRQLVLQQNLLSGALPASLPGGLAEVQCQNNRLSGATQCALTLASLR